MLYYVPWILLITASLAASLIAFLWALRNGQFSEQQRARYLPLREESIPAAGKDSSRLSWEVYFLLFILGAGGLMMFAALWVLGTGGGR